MSTGVNFGSQQRAAARPSTATNTIAMLTGADGLLCPYPPPAFIKDYPPTSAPLLSPPRSHETRTERPGPAIVAGSSSDTARIYQKAVELLNQYPLHFNSITTISAWEDLYVYFDSYDFSIFGPYFLWGVLQAMSNIVAAKIDAIRPVVRLWLSNDTKRTRLLSIIGEDGCNSQEHLLRTILDAFNTDEEFVLRSDDTSDDHDMSASDLEITRWLLESESSLMSFEEASRDLSTSPEPIDEEDPVLEGEMVPQAPTSTQGLLATPEPAEIPEKSELALDDEGAFPPLGAGRRDVGQHGPALDFGALARRAALAAAARPPAIRAEVAAEAPLKSPSGESRRGVWTTTRRSTLPGCEGWDEVISWDGKTPEEYDKLAHDKYFDEFGRPRR